MGSTSALRLSGNLSHHTVGNLPYGIHPSNFHQAKFHGGLGLFVGQSHYTNYIGGKNCLSPRLKLNYQSSTLSQSVNN